MGSSQQIIVGFLLLVSAFVVGRYVHNKPINLGETDFFTSQLEQANMGQANKKADVPDSVFVRKPQTLFPSGDTSRPTDGDSLQQSLRQRILGSRGAMPNTNANTNDSGYEQQFPQSVFKPKIDDTRMEAPELLSSTPTKQFNSIVEPDFSHLESQSIPELPVPDIELGDQEIATAPLEAIAEPQLELRQPKLNPPSPDLTTYDRQPRDRSSWHRTPRLDWSQETNLRPEPSESISIRTPRRMMPLAPKTTPFAAPVEHGTPVDRDGSTSQQFAQPARRMPSQADLQPKLKANAQLSNVLARDQHLPIAASDYLEYTCKRNDTLHSISKKYYGVSNYYLDIYIHNREVMRNPSDVRAGVELRIPVYSK